MAHWAGDASTVLTQHYRQARADALPGAAQPSVRAWCGCSDLPPCARPYVLATERTAWRGPPGRIRRGIGWTLVCAGACRWVRGRVAGGPGTAPRRDRDVPKRSHAADRVGACRACSARRRGVGGPRAPAWLPQAATGSRSCVGRRGGTTRPSGRSWPVSSKRTTPLHSRLHPCSGWAATVWAASRSGWSAGGHGGRCGHIGHLWVWGYLSLWWPAARTFHPGGRVTSCRRALARWSRSPARPARGRG